VGRGNRTSGQPRTAWALPDQHDGPLEVVLPKHTAPSGPHPPRLLRAVFGVPRGAQNSRESEGCGGGNENRRSGPKRRLGMLDDEDTKE